MTDRPPYAPTHSTSAPFASISDEVGSEDSSFAVFVWDADLEGFVWANTVGLDRWGALSLTSLRASRLDRAMPAMAKLKELSQMALPVEGVIQALTFWTPRGACRMTCRCRPIDLGDGGHGLVLEATDGYTHSDPDDAGAEVRSNGRTTYLPHGVRTNANGSTRPNAATATQVPGYLSETESFPNQTPSVQVDDQARDLPGPTDDDHFAMQEIARMLGRAGHTNGAAKTAIPSPTTSGSIDSGRTLRNERPQPEQNRPTETPPAPPPIKNAATRFDTLNHELRTPLNSIIGFAEMMQREQLGPIGNARYKEYAGDILDSARHALSLINDLLDASRVRAGHMDVAAEDIDVPELLDRVIALMEPQSQKASVTVVRGYPPELPPLAADTRALRQILLNVLTNAFKFTPSGGHVFISAQHDADYMVLDVRDTGIGMTEEQIDGALTPWVRGNGDGIPTSTPVGTGLGLPLVKALTEAQMGTLAITSAPGEGTCVTVRLPLHQARTGRETQPSHS